MSVTNGICIPDMLSAPRRGADRTAQTCVPCEAQRCNGSRSPRRIACLQWGGYSTLFYHLAPTHAIWRRLQSWRPRTFTLLLAPPRHGRQCFHHRPPPIPGANPHPGSGIRIPLVHIARATYRTGQYGFKRSSRSRILLQARPPPPQPSIPRPVFRSPLAPLGGPGQETPQVDRMQETKKTEIREKLRHAYPARGWVCTMPPPQELLFLDIRPRPMQMRSRLPEAVKQIPAFQSSF
jgi:hypothetical protein